MADQKPHLWERMLRRPSSCGHPPDPKSRRKRLCEQKRSRRRLFVVREDVAEIADFALIFPRGPRSEPRALPRDYYASEFARGPKCGPAARRLRALRRRWGVADA